MAILALAEGAQNDQNERGEGGSSLWVPNNCGKQVLHLKEVSVSKFQRIFDIFAHFTLHWFSGRYQYQTERTGLNSTNTYNTNTIFF